MTAVPEAPAAPAVARRERIAVELPPDVTKRLRVWAALRGQPAAHVVSDVVCQAVPTDEQLAELVQRNGEPHDQH